MTPLILIVDDDPIQRRLLDAQISRLGLEARQCDGGRAAIDFLSGPEAKRVSAMVLDLMMPDRDGGDVMAEMRRRRLDIPVIVQTAKGSIDTVVEAMKAGAFDFVVKPVSPDKLRATLDKALKVSAANRRRSRGEDATPSLLAAAGEASPALSPVLAAAAKAAFSGIAVLIGGETGVGKEWLARAISAESPRRAGPFVTVNCGALPGDLVESLLFGHAKGAFTDASATHVGKFVEADGGTLFLDEVGELPPMAQVKLLRVLQDGEIDPIGGRRPIRTDVRIISATNRDLSRDVAEGRFREDLYYRLNAFELTVPPLRERRCEIDGLARRFVERLVETERQTPVRSLGAAALALLCRYDWPGNVRQLENVLHRAVVLGETATLTEADFPQIAALMNTAAPAAAPGSSPDRRPPDGVLAAARKEPVSRGTNRPDRPATVVEERRRIVDRRQSATGREGGMAAPEPQGEPGVGRTRQNAAGSFPLRGADGQVRAMDAIEADLIRLALNQYGGRMSEIARRLGIGRSTLYRKMREYGIGGD